MELWDKRRMMGMLRSCAVALWKRGIMEKKEKLFDYLGIMRGNELREGLRLKGEK